MSVATLQQLFWNQSERRLHAGWRILFYFVLWRLASSLFDLLVAPPVTTFWQGVSTLLTVEGAWFERSIHFLFYLVSVLLVTAAAARWLDHRPLRSYGLRLDRAWWWDLAGGMAIGGALMTLIFLVEWGLGWVSVTALFQIRIPTLPFALALLGPLGFFVLVAFSEELMFRGYLLRNVAEGFGGETLGAQNGLLLAWALSSALFGLLHIFNPNSSWASTLILVLAGLLLGLPMILTGRLGLSIGLHLTWNFFQGNVFGFPVSGNDFSGVTILAVHQAGPDVWTGGRFGPEAGLLGLGAIMLGFAFVLLWVRWRYGGLRLDLALARYP
jgi:membrane protease YdiL (CAAX protease family)